MSFDAAFFGRAARVRFVLVAPSHPGNIGAAARALKTMGFARLAVVTPRVAAFAADPDAIAFATGAADVLGQARTFASLSDALAGVAHAYAMSGYAREFGPPLVDLRSAAAQTAVHLAHAQGEIAFVFGTERTGLLNEDVERCQSVCAIPVNPAFGSLNLAQAVQVTAYECQLALRASHTVGPSQQPFAAEPPATHDQLEGMYAHLERALTAVGYHDPSEPKFLLPRLRRLLNRAQPTATEIDIVRGICAAILKPKRARAGSK
jgi:tRNA/rRNA methyltransferase